MAKLPISKIRVRSRYRKNLGDIASLAANIKELGLLHPIVVRPGGRLIAGKGDWPPAKNWAGNRSR